MIRIVHRSLVERRLAEVSDRLRALREELRIIDEQLVHLGDDADDARLRALVSETPLADREHRDAHRHADAMAGAGPRWSRRSPRSRPAGRAARPAHRRLTADRRLGG